MLTRMTGVVAAGAMFVCAQGVMSDGNAPAGSKSTTSATTVGVDGGGPTVLIYEEETLRTSAYVAAVADLGWPYTIVTSGESFESQLQTGGYTHVIAAHQDSSGAGVWEDDLVDWAQDNPGSPILISDWRVNDPQPYLDELGFAYTGSTNLGFVDGLPETLLEGLASPLDNPGWGIYSYGVVGDQVLAVDHGMDYAEPIVVRNGCWFFNGFLSDTLADLDVGVEIVQRELQCGRYVLIGVTGDGSPTSESLFEISLDDASIDFRCELGRGDDGEAIGWNPDDQTLYHASGHSGAYDPDLDEGVIFERVPGIGGAAAGVGCSTVDIDISKTDLTYEETQALTYWESEGVFLWKQNHGEGPLFSVTADGEPTYIGDLDHQAKGLAFAYYVDSGLGLFSVASSDNYLRVVSPFTGDTLGSWPIVTKAPCEILSGNALATHPVTGELWAVLKVVVEASKGEETTRVLARLNMAPVGDGDEGVIAEIVGELDERFAGIAFVQEGGAFEDCNDNGIPDNVETAPLELVDPDAQPAADCEDAPLIGPGILFEGTSVTTDLLMPNPLNPFFCGLLVGVEDVFYRYIPCYDGLVFITVEGPPINWLYGVYDDCPPSKECLIDCNEIDHFEVIFEAEKGKEYWIRIAGQYFITGNFELYMLGPDTQLNPNDCNFNQIPDECECLADVNGDGYVDKIDFGLVIAAFGATCDGCPEDVDGSGIVDMADAVIVSEEMGPCPFGDDGGS